MVYSKDKNRILRRYIMPRKIKIGVLGAADIAIKKVLPAMKNCQHCEVYAIASRNLEKAKWAADKLGIEKAYGSYEELLYDNEIEAVYLPLPNHLHVEWIKKSLRAGKHVLCEKPLSLNTDDIKEIIKLRDEKNLKVNEAFMVRTHPQWLKTKELIESGEIGKLELINGFFSYYNVDENNIRNISKYGGGSIYDLGCYLINTSRYIFGEEPIRVVSSLKIDEKFNTDKLASVIMEFPSGRAVFTSATQLMEYQRMQFFGDKKMLEMRIPFNSPVDKKTEIYINEGNILENGKLLEDFESCNQYTLQGDMFSLSIIEDKPVAVPLEDSLKNIAVIEAIFRSANTGKWEKPNI
jgi:predicted dehydrogenase